MNRVTSSYAVAGTGMRRTLENSVTQWTDPEMGLEGTLKGASPVKTLVTQDRSSSNTVTASRVAENRRDGNSLTVAEISTLTLTARGAAPDQWAPLRSISGCRTTGWMIGKMQECTISKINGETQTIVKLIGALWHKIGQTP